MEVGGGGARTPGSKIDRQCYSGGSFIKLVVLFFVFTLELPLLCRSRGGAKRFQELLLLAEGEGEEEEEEEEIRL